jgi:hypothetical protein
MNCCNGTPESHDYQRVIECDDELSAAAAGSSAVPASMHGRRQHSITHRITMLPTKGVLDVDLALGLVIDALREKM